MVSARREVNDFRRKAFGNAPDRLVAFVCECADDRCRRAVLMTVAEYDEVRAAERDVLLDVSHAPPDDAARRR
jgi:hypothetical protein